MSSNASIGARAPTGAVLVHDSERRWRVFHEWVEAIRGDEGHA